MYDLHVNALCHHYDLCLSFDVHTQAVFHRHNKSLRALFSMSYHFSQLVPAEHNAHNQHHLEVRKWPSHAQSRSSVENRVDEIADLRCRLPERASAVRFIVSNLCVQNGSKSAYKWNKVSPE